MSISTAKEQKKLVTEDVISRRRRLAIASPLLLALVPFVPWQLIAIIGLGCGLYLFRLTREEVALTKAELPDSRYAAHDIKDCDFGQDIYVGQGMDFADWRGGLDKVEHAVGHLTADIKREYAVEKMPSMFPVFLNDDLLTRHMALIASTGLGKTEFMTTLVTQSIRRGGGAIIFEAKGDEKFLCRLYAICKKYGRLNDLRFISFERPEISNTYNPFIYGGARQAISTSMKLQGKTKEEFFRNLNRYAMAAAVVCLLGQPNRPRFNFQDLMVLFKDLETFARLWSQMPDDNPDKMFVFHFLSYWKERDLKTGQEYFNTKLYRERLLGLVASIGSFCHSEYAPLLNDYDPDIELKDAILSGKIVVVSIPALSDKEGVTMFGKLFIADLSRAIGEIQQQREKSPFAYPVILDEYGSFLDKDHQELFQLARSANISLMISVQSRGFLAEESENFADNILSNCWSHFFMDVRDNNTREFAAKMGGTIIRNFKTTSEGQSFGFNYGSEETGAIRGESQGSSSSVGSRAMRETMLQPEDFWLEEGEALFIAKSGVMRLRLPLVEFKGKEPSINQIKLPRPRKSRVKGLNLWSTAVKDQEALMEMINNTGGRRP